MARAAWTSALLAVMCLTSLARHHAAAGAAVDHRVCRLGHRGLADRGRRRRRAAGPTATACRARVVSQGGDAGRRVCDRAGLAGHARPVRRRGDREGRAHSLQPSSPSPSSAAGRSLGGLVQRLVCDHRRTTAARAARRRARRPGPAADAGPRADAAGGHRPARGAVAAAGLGEALSRLLRQPSAVPLSPEARATLVEGLRGAALYGTASAFSERGLDVLAKTGTATQRGGRDIGRRRRRMAPERADARDRSVGRRRGRKGRRRPGGRDSCQPPAERSEALSPPARERRAPRPAERSEAPPSPRASEASAPPRAQRRARRTLSRRQPHARVGALASRRSPSRTTWLACWRAKPPPEVRPRRLKRLPWPCGPSPSATAGDTSETALTSARSRTARC